MKPAIGQLSYIGENAEFVAAGMDTDAVAKLFGDLCVSGKFHPESVNITDIINAFLELPAESRRQASKNHRPSLQFAGDKEMRCRTCFGLRFVDRHFQCHGMRTFGNDVVVDHLNEIKRFAIDKVDTWKLFRRKTNVSVIAQCKMPASIGGIPDVDLCVTKPLAAERFGLRPPQRGGSVINMLGAIQRDHRISVSNCLMHPISGFQMVAIRSIAPFIAGLKHLPRHIVQHRTIRTSGERQLTLRLLGQDGKYRAAAKARI